jgi:NADPH:quinone reductase-like Zn-dependent oxidoreductase
LKLRVNHVLPLAEAGTAHRLLEGRQSTGKIVLKVVD